MRWNCRTGNEQPPDPWLWRRSNETFVPALEPLIFIYVSPGVILTLLTGLGHVHKQINFRTQKPQCVNACGFFNGG
jgi:hypothetical protein